jgi:hypothetical protein
VVLVLAGPSLFIAAISGLFAARGWPERRAKLGLTASAAAIMILGGPIAYLFGLLSIPHR